MNEVISLVCFFNPHPRREDIFSINFLESMEGRRERGRKEGGERERDIRGERKRERLRV